MNIKELINDDGGVLGTEVQLRIAGACNSNKLKNSFK